MVAVCTTNVYKLDAYMYDVAGVILDVGSTSMRLGRLIRADWRWLQIFSTIKRGKSRYRLYWVESKRNQNLKNYIL